MHKVNCLFLLLTCCNCKDAITTLQNTQIILSNMLKQKCRTQQMIFQ